MANQKTRFFIIAIIAAAVIVVLLLMWRFGALGPKEEGKILNVEVTRVKEPDEGVLDDDWYSDLDFLFEMMQEDLGPAELARYGLSESIEEYEDYIFRGGYTGVTAVYIGEAPFGLPGLGSGSGKILYMPTGYPEARYYRVRYDLDGVNADTILEAYKEAERLLADYAEEDHRVMEGFISGDEAQHFINEDFDYFDILNLFEGEGNDFFMRSYWNMRDENENVDDIGILLERRYDRQYLIIQIRTFSLDDYPERPPLPGPFSEAFSELFNMELVSLLGNSNGGLKSIEGNGGVSYLLDGVLAVVDYTGSLADYMIVEYQELIGPVPANFWLRPVGSVTSREFFLTFIEEDNALLARNIWPDDFVVIGMVIYGDNLEYLFNEKTATYDELCDVFGEQPLLNPIPAEMAIANGYDFDVWECTFHMEGLLFNIVFKDNSGEKLPVSIMALIQ